MWCDSLLETDASVEQTAAALQGDCETAQPLQVYAL